MKNVIKVSSLALALVAAGAQAENLLPAADTDLVAGAPTSLATNKAMIPGVSRDAVSFTFPIAADTQIASAPAPSETRSREYFVEVDASELRSGATLFTTAPGALIRINPAAGEQLQGKAAGLAVDPASLVIRTAGGDSFTAGEGTSLLVDAAQIKATGVPFAAGTTAFRLAPEVGVGAITVAAPGLRSDAKYAIHVFDRESDAVLALQAASMDFFHGQDLRMKAQLEDAGGAFAADHLQAFVTAPSGDAWSVDLRQGVDGIRATMPLDAVRGAGPGLWELHMVAQGDRDGLTVVRNASTAFAVHLPTAALTGKAEIQLDRGLEIELGIGVGAPGRYEVRGVIFGTDASGDSVPFASAHSADWMVTDGTLTLTVEPNLLREAGVRAPFEVQDLRLLDQGRMGVLHRQALGLVIH